MEELSQDWLVSLRNMINNLKQATPILVISVIILVNVVLVNNTLTKPVVENQYYTIADRAHKAEISDDNLRDRVLQLEEMLQNALNRISELEEDRQCQGTISELQGRVDQLEEDTTCP